MDYREKIETLREDAMLNMLSPVAVDLTLEAVRIADTHGDVELGAESRMDLMNYAGTLGRPELIVIHFPWLIAKCRENPDLVEPERLRFFYFNALWSLSNFPDVPWELIEQTLDEYTQLAQSTGLKKAIYLQCLRNAALQTGQLEKATTLHAEFKAAIPINDYDRMLGEASIEAYDRSWDALYHYFRGEYEEALREVRPILDGQIDAWTTETYILGIVMMTTVFLGKPEIGLPHVGKLLRELRRQPDILSPTADVSVYLSVTGNWQIALPIFEARVGTVHSKKDTLETMDIAAAWALMFKIIRMTGVENLKLRIPRSVPYFEESGEYSVEQLEEFYREISREQAAAFDRRNQNDHFIGMWQQIMDLEPIEPALSLPKNVRF